jgi:flagellar biosynthesis protein FlhG
MVDRPRRDRDQAEGLRRLFGPAPVRIAPMLVERGCVGAQVAGLARFAQACAATGLHTLVLDAARAQFAAALGLRARFDLLHVQRGECLRDQALIDAGPRLAVLPVARAAAATTRDQPDVCAQALALTDAAFAADLVLLLFDPEQVELISALAAAEVVVALPLERTTWPRLLGALAPLADNADIAAFRLLFPAWEAESAARLYADLARACRARLRPELRFGGAVPVARDWMHVARSSTEWALARLPRPHHVRTF